MDKKVPHKKRDRYRTSSRGGGEVDMNDTGLQEKLRDLRTLIDTYEVNNVYNKDETGLFFRIVPRYTLLLQGKDVKRLDEVKRQGNTSRLR
jgi:hypothetical protein